MTPAVLDIDLQRGNTEARRFRFRDSTGVLIDISGSTFVFRAVRGSLVIRKTLTNSSSTETDLSLSISETRSLPRDLPVAYELERWIDTSQETVLQGRLFGRGGDNDDA